MTAARPARSSQPFESWRAAAVPLERNDPHRLRAAPLAGRTDPGSAHNSAGVRPAPGRLAPSEPGFWQRRVGHRSGGALNRDARPIGGHMGGGGIRARFVRAAYLGSVPSEVLQHDAAEVVFDTTGASLWSGLRAARALGLVVAVAAYPPVRPRRRRPLRPYPGWSGMVAIPPSGHGRDRRTHSREIRPWGSTATAGLDVDARGGSARVLGPPVPERRGRGHPGVLAVPVLLVVLAVGESLPESRGQSVPDDDPDDLDDGTPADDAGQRMQTAHANASQTSA
jgi:hypothetical protein